MRCFGMRATNQNEAVDCDGADDAENPLHREKIFGLVMKMSNMTQKVSKINPHQLCLKKSSAMKPIQIPIRISWISLCMLFIVCSAIHTQRGTKNPASQRDDHTFGAGSSCHRGCQR
jgi:hypothetical protein